VKVGIIGAGQLGRMLALAGYRLGVRTVFLDPDGESSGSQVGRTIVGEINDAARIRELAAEVDVLTFDIESLAPEILAETAIGTPIYPPPAALAVTRDRLFEKRLFGEIGFPTAAYLRIDSSQDLATVPSTLDWPVVLKARRLGYDGRGQRIVRNQAELATAWETLGGGAAIAEAWVDFERELSLIGVRDSAGNTAFYPLSENIHDGGILTSTFAPLEDDTLQSDAEECLLAIMRKFDYRGVLAVEFFQARSGLIANEIAPRVHNSGHWTIEGADTSQFENHIRAILGLPLGSTAARGCSVMVNLLGEIPPRDVLLRVPGLYFHDYGKTPRPLRKLGHCTIVDTDRKRLETRARDLRNIVKL
jgi:5-(carboxyamino)imidazole ribonucleotide synthase